MNAVFDTTLQTDRRKKHAREHENDYDDQSVHQNLNSFCIESTNDRVSASTTLGHISQNRIMENH